MNGILRSTLNMWGFFNCRQVAKNAAMNNVHTVAACVVEAAQARRQTIRVPIVWISCAPTRIARVRLFSAVLKLVFFTGVLRYENGM
jgi:hypothetical protein